MQFSACRVKHSEARRVILAEQIGRILDAKSEDTVAKQVFITQLCMESNFNPTAKSPAGARGIAQIMPATGISLAKELGYGEIRPEDLEDVELGVTLGFHFMLSLLEQFQGNIALAAAAYNSGPASSSVKGMGTLQRGNLETGWYVANIFHLLEKLRISQSTPEC